MDYSSLIDQLIEGNPRAAARLITIVENDIEIAEKIVSNIYNKTGNAYILGVTGAPGSGKSTFISTITKIFVDKGKKVGIICVDPTSPLTGGALLGDRIRMKQNFTLENVFIRSMANRGQLGGLARATEDAIKILEDIYSEPKFVPAFIRPNLEELAHNLAEAFKLPNEGWYRGMNINYVEFTFRNTNVCSLYNVNKKNTIQYILIFILLSYFKSVS